MRDNMTMTATTDQWMQFYQQPLMDSHGHDHDHDHDHHALAPNTTEGFSSSPTPTMPSSESNSILSQLSPKGNVSKPIRRRSRASKRTPTTLLNANPTNFRALVQQFTGCPRTTMSTLGVHKGPITLNFQQGSSSTEQKVHHHNTSSRVVLPVSGRSYNNNNNNNQFHQVPAPFPNWQKQEEQQQQLPQQSGYSFDYVKNNGFLPSSGNSIRPTTISMDHVSDGLLLDNDFNLADLTVNGFPNDALYESEL
ncbi:VQ motif-containing protein 22 [Glycine soja]